VGGRDGNSFLSPDVIGLMPDWMDSPDWVDEMFEPIRRRSLEANTPPLEKLDVSRADPNEWPRSVVSDPTLLHRSFGEQWG
jgi:hypothetical protein